MRQLVRDDVRDASLADFVGLSFVEQEGRRAVGDQAPVFHGSVRKLVDGEEISLGQGVIDVEDLGEVIDDFVGLRERETALFFEAACRVDPYRELLTPVFAARKVFDVLEVAKGPGEELDWSTHLDMHR